MNRHARAHLIGLVEAWRTRDLKAACVPVVIPMALLHEAATIWAIQGTRRMAQA